MNDRVVPRKSVPQLILIGWGTLFSTLFIIKNNEGVDSYEVYCSTAWLHHKGRNKHHYEYWIDYPAKGGDGSLVGMEMPVNYVVEMFCDRVAASKIYNKDKYKDSDSLEYFKRGMNHYIMHPKTKELIYSLLTMLAEKGEDYTFAYIKENVLK